MRLSPPDTLRVGCWFFWELSAAPFTPGSQYASEPEQLVAAGSFPLVLSQQYPGGQPGKARPVAAGPHREQMTRKIPVQTHERETIHSFVTCEILGPFGLKAGDRGIERRELVHQLPGPLDERLVARARRNLRLVGPRKHDAVLAH